MSTTAIEVQLRQVHYQRTVIEPLARHFQRHMAPIIQALYVQGMNILRRPRMDAYEALSNRKRYLQRIIELAEQP